MPAICKAQTTKQAKASFKSRGRPSLSNKEQRQLERAIELEERAERAKEAQKRRTDIAKKRGEKEKHEQAERQKAHILSQRKRDKFGFQASQFHLAAFFAPQHGAANSLNTIKATDMPQQEDSFEDEELDDEELLRALEPVHASPVSRRSDCTLMPPPPRPSVVALKRSTTVSTPVPDQDLSMFLDELESSTQIARELRSASPEQPEPEPEPEPEPLDDRSASFGSQEFDLTAEDMDELDPPEIPKSFMTKAPIPATQMAKTLTSAFVKTLPSGPAKVPLLAAAKAMPPPPLPKKAMPTSPAKVMPSSQARAMPPPPLKAMRPSQVPTKLVQTRFKAQNAIRGPFLPASSLYCSPDLGFTLTQLEGFVDDDLQLTQALPG